jgi:hypothetical protein
MRDNRLNLQMYELMGIVDKANQMCREMGTDWEAVLQRKAASAKVMVVNKVGDAIRTIKTIRDVTGWSLKEAKAAWDNSHEPGTGYELMRGSIRDCENFMDKLATSDPTIKGNFDLILLRETEV